MSLRRRTLILSLLIAALLTAVVGGSIGWLVQQQFMRAEDNMARETILRVRRSWVQNGVARADKNTLVFDSAPDYGKLSRLAGYPVQAGAKAPDAARATALLKSNLAVAFPAGSGMAGWTAARQGKSAIILRAVMPRRLDALRNRVLVGLAGALLLGGLLLGSATALVIDRLVLRRLQARLQSANDEKGDIALKPAPDVSGLTHELEASQKRGKESEELFRQMAVNASDVLYAIYPDSGRIEWFGLIDQMLGYANGSFPRTIEAWAEHIHPDEAEGIIALYSQACTNNEPFAVEYRMRHRNGSYRTWSHRGRPLFDSNKRLQRVIGACTDITDRKKAEARLRASEEKMTRIFETAADAILIVQHDDKITFANPAAELIFGAGRSDIINSSYAGGAWKICKPGNVEFPHEQWPAVWAMASGEAVYQIEHTVEQSSGKVVVVSVNAAPLRDENGEASSAVLSITDVTGRKALEDRLTFQAFHDPLTRLPNRALLMDRLRHALVRAKRSKTEVAVMFLDLDNFKKTNDTLGHDAGDDLLKATAERLLTCVRGGDTAARFAGDEFVLLLDNIVDEAGALVVANRVLNTLLEPVSLKGEQVYAPPSIGVALGHASDDADVVLKRADSAMYQAKHGGKAQYVFWREDADGEPAEQLEESAHV